MKPEDLPEKPKKVKRTVAPPPAPVAPPVVEPPKTEVLQPIEEKTEEKKESNFFFIGILFAIFAHLFFKAHLSIKAPLQPGSTLAVGRSKHSCGLLGAVPLIKCTRKSMSMDKEGTLNIFEGEELVFSLSGKVCGADEEGCVDGVVVGEDGTLLIGGEKAKAKSKPTSELSPWPFTEDIVYKTGFRLI